MRFQIDGIIHNGTTYTIYAWIRDNESKAYKFEVIKVSPITKKRIGFYPCLGSCHSAICEDGNIPIKEETKIYWGIVELHNGLFDCVRAPYDSQEKAMNHKDKILEYRKKNPNPITYEYRVIRIYHPEYI